VLGSGAGRLERPAPYARSWRANVSARLLPIFGREQEAESGSRDAEVVAAQRRGERESGRGLTYRKPEVDAVHLVVFGSTKVFGMGGILAPVEDGTRNGPTENALRGRSAASFAEDAARDNGVSVAAP
jgi:hypothetical protein